MGKRENKVETYLNTQVEKLGGVTRKWTGRRSVPDRLCALPFIGFFVVETKTADGHLEEHQAREHTRLRDAGGRVYVVWGHDDVDTLIEMLESEMRRAKSFPTEMAAEGLHE